MHTTVARIRIHALLLLVIAFGCAREPDDPRARPRDHVRAAVRNEVAQLANGDTITLSEETREFYRKRRFRPAWVEDEGLTERGEGVFQALGRAGADGLSPEQYRWHVARAIRQQLANAEAADEDSMKVPVARLMGELDVILTEGVNRFTNDLAQGTLDPAESGLDWRIPHEHVWEESVLEALETGRSPEEIVAAMRPKASQYQRYMQALARYTALQEKGVEWPKLPAGLSVKPGDRGPGVVQLRQRLATSPDPLEAKLAAAGNAQPEVYDEQLAQAVKRFQERHSIEGDGALGAATVRELNHTLAERIDELRLNMDRWRWLPHELGERYVMVNVAGFELEVIENNRVIEAMNVVVGQQSWSTPIFADTMEHVVVNPYWNVPESIMEDEIRPAMARDPNYLARNNMELTSDGTARQRPGDGNALGRFKFLFPNKDNIYLHDTPAKSLFSRTRRDFSHGCIRLERPRDLALLLAGKYAGKSEADIERLLATGTEQWIELNQKIPVYIMYFTAFVQEDGTVRFHHDVYGRDEQLDDQKQRKLT